jgi:mRNA deadenylase 3'-5' endonuclease subunit Ccr4
MLLLLALQHILLCALLVMATVAELPIRLITHNIRYATSSPFTGEKPWVDRKPLLLSELKYNTMYNAEAFICLQEVLHNQVVDVMSGLGDECEFVLATRSLGMKHWPVCRMMLDDVGNTR